MVVSWTEVDEKNPTTVYNSITQCITHGSYKHISVVQEHQIRICIHN